MKKSPQRFNKSEWIRSQPATVSAQDLVTLAKKEGISLTVAHVYTARYEAKKRGGSTRKPGRPAVKNGGPAVKNGGLAVKDSGPAVKKSNGSGGKSNGHDIKVEFVHLAMRIGTDEAKRLLDRIVSPQQV